MNDPLIAIKDFSDHYSEDLQSYFDILRIPSISTEPEHESDMLRVVDFLTSYFKKLGMDSINVFPTDIHPILFAEKHSSDPGAKTLLIYGHYDVQPVDPLAEWATPPFEPGLINDRLFARGASDMKGQIMASIFALESVLRSGELPLNIKYILEGEEEIGSPSFDNFVANHKDLLKCDMILNPDAGMVGADKPTIVYGLRGLVYFELRLDGPKADLHSGLFGGIVANPAIVLSEIIAKLHNPDGSVAIPGFYDKVLPLSDLDKQKIAATGLSDEEFLRVTGSPKLYGESGFSALERLGARPTLDVNGIYSGFIGEGAKTIIPAYAKAKISCRIVPNQDPEEIYLLAQRYIARLVPNTVRATFYKYSASPAYLADDAPGLSNLSDALSTTWGKPITLKREGGSIPVANVMQEMLGVKSLLTGFGLPDDAIHAPNEHQHLPTWKKGVESLIRFYLSFGR